MDVSLFSGKKPFRFNDFYAGVSKTLNKECIPFLRRSLSSAAHGSVLSTDVHLVFGYLRTYYEALNEVADSDTISYFLFPSSRNSIETPLLFLGDIHPYFLISLVRSFIHRANQDSDENFLDHHAAAWKNPSDELVKRIVHIEGTMRLRVNDLTERMKKAHILYVARVSDNWVSLHHPQVTATATATSASEDETAKEGMDELVSIFVDANHLRWSVISDIVTATSGHQKTLFLESLCHFLVGFKDQGQEFQNSPSASPVMFQQHTPEPPHVFPKPAPSGDRTLWMGNLKDYMDSNFLVSCFAQTEGFVFAKVMCNKETGQSKGFGFIDFNSHAAAKLALERHDNTPIPGAVPAQWFRLNWSRWNKVDYMIFVGDLSEDVTVDMLIETFRFRGGYSSVKTAKIVTDKATGRSRGYGFVNFSDEGEQLRAMVEMNGVFCSTRPMRIGPARLQPK